jgi:thiol-disulfide isomerase/thioredoxin
MPRTILIPLLLLSLNLHSQLENKTRLSVGDKIAGIILGTDYYYPEKTIRHADIKAKLVLLDFWSAWCMSCIRAMPSLDSLQAEFGSDTRILMLSFDKEKDIRNVLSKIKFKPRHLTFLHADAALKKLFPHNTVPHHIWIDQTGTIRHITHGYNATKENIGDFLLGKSLDLSVKNELEDFDTSQPLWMEGGGRHSSLLQYYSLLMKRMEGYGGASVARKVDSAKGTVTIRCINQSILSLFKYAFGNFPEGRFDAQNRIILEGNNTVDLLPPPDKSLMQAWASRNLFCYELTVPLSQAGEFFSIMQQDMNRYFDFEAKIEMRKTRCLVLLRTSDADKLKTAGAKPWQYSDKDSIFISNLDFRKSFVRSLMSMNAEIPTPVIDETGYRGKCDLSLGAGFTNLAALRRELKKYDLDIAEAERTIEILVIRNKKNP